jgi:hypothetical protein
MKDIQKKRMKIIGKNTCVGIIYMGVYYLVFNLMAKVYMGHPLDVTGWNIFAQWLYKYIMPIILCLFPAWMCVRELLKTKRIGG